MELLVVVGVEVNELGLVGRSLGHVTLVLSEVGEQIIPTPALSAGLLFDSVEITSGSSDDERGVQTRGSTQTMASGIPQSRRSSPSVDR